MYGIDKWKLWIICAGELRAAESLSHTHINANIYTSASRETTTMGTALDKLIINYITQIGNRKYGQETPVTT